MEVVRRSLTALSAHELCVIWRGAGSELINCLTKSDMDSRLGTETIELLLRILILGIAIVVVTVIASEAAISSPRRIIV